MVRPAEPHDPRENNWTLVAARCVEAGVNLSFRTCLRERAALVNLLQAAGRVNREGRMATADIWTFTLRQTARLAGNRAFDEGASVLDGLFERHGSVRADAVEHWPDGSLVYKQGPRRKRE